MKKEINIFAKKNGSVGEIQLFKELHRHLKKNYKSTFIDETHQQYVEFKSQTTGCQKKRELSDLWIIAYSPKRNEARMTFLQAKLDKRSSLSKFSFKGDYFQYELLSKRPLIKDKSKFGFPDDILSGASFDSVGSFGVFYHDAKRRFDFAYSTASDICVKNIATANSAVRQLYFRPIKYNNAFIKIQNTLKIELRCTLNADCFEFALINLFIGTEIQNDKKIIKFLKLYFKKMSTTNNVVLDFIDFLNTLDDIPNESSTQDMGNPNILLINVDRRE